MITPRLAAAAAGMGIVAALAVAAPAQANLADDIASLTVAAEQRAGYDRDLFGDYDRPALLDASLAEHGCYFSAADDLCYSDAGEVDVDHIVALAEAWDSGAHSWTAAQLDEFAGTTSNLWLMTDNLNQSKSDDDIPGREGRLLAPLHLDAGDQDRPHLLTRAVRPHLRCPRHPGPDLAASRHRVGQGG